MTARTDERREDIRLGVQEARDRIDRARAAAGRVDPVRLVVVTKTFPSSDVDILAELGVTDVGENRSQEASAKRESVGMLAHDLRWHMIGQVQTNKARQIVSWADVVESVDRASAINALDRAAQAAERRLDVLLQVNLDPDPVEGRGGARPVDVPRLAEVVAASASLRLIGVMGVAPHPGSHPPSASAREAFDRLAAVAASLRGEHPEAWEISAGMSGDLEEAVAAGATQVRIGGAVLGARVRVE